MTTTSLRSSRRHARGLAYSARAAKEQAAGEVARAERSYAKALEHLDESTDAEDVGVALSNLGLLYKSTGRFAEARATYDRALILLERTLGPAHPQVATLLFNFAQLLKELAKAMEARAEQLEADAKEVREPEVSKRAVLKPEHTRFRLRVRASRVHRFGVYAEEAIPGGAAVIEYTGETIGRREAVRRWNANRTYLFRLNDHQRLDGSVNGSGAELVNHSCEPNVRFGREAGRVWIVSLRAIARGEELYLDYAFPHDSPRIECHCGAGSCRGTINALPPPVASRA